VTTSRTARTLARYNAWADMLIFEAVAALPPGEAEKPRQSIFKSIAHTLNHNSSGACRRILDFGTFI
jgi:uncharacterized damage-inducible protein DinB